MEDLVESIDHPTYAEQVRPYKKFGDGELAVSLYMFARKFGGPGIGSPAARGADYHCPECDADVRGVSIDGEVLLCPMCHHQPGLLTLGTGPTDAD